MEIFNYFAYPRCVKIFPGVLNNSCGNISIIQHISALGATDQTPNGTKYLKKAKRSN
jgi:hypothetical protein